MEKMYQLLIDKGDSQEKAKGILDDVLLKGSTLSQLYWLILANKGGNPFSLQDYKKMMAGMPNGVGLQANSLTGFYPDSQDELNYLLKYNYIRELK